MSETVQIPKGWELKKIEEICSKITDGEHLKPKVVSKGVPFLSAKNLKEDKIDFRNVLYVSETDSIKFRKKCNPEKNDILIGSRGSIGTICIVNTSEPFCLLGSVILLKPLPLIQSNFLTYFLKSSQAQIQLLGASGHSVVKALYLKDIKNLEIPFPSLSAQKKIVQKLDDILGQLEEKKKEIFSIIEQNTQRIDFFEKNWISYLIENEIENHPKRKDWKLKKLNELVTVISGYAFKSSDFTKNGIPVITIFNVGHGFFINKSEKFLPVEYTKKYSNFLVKPNYILLALTRPFTDNNTLKVCKYPHNIKNSLLNQRVAMLIPSKNVNEDFILNIMQTKNFKEQMTGIMSKSLQPNLSSTKLPLATILYPPLPIQKQIVQNIKSAEEKFQSQKVQFQNIKQNYEKTINHINHIQSSILNAAFLGKLVQ